MKALKKENQSALDEFCKNEFWRTYYENAPVGVKEFIEHGFKHSLNLHADDGISLEEAKRRSDERESKMSDNDIRFLADYGWHPMMRSHYRKILEKRLSAKNKNEKPA